jgi:broad specificity phosphatase PhoE
MRLIIVRHGETDYNKTGRFQGQQQIPLNELGRTQAQLDGEALKQYRFTHIYCSNLIRAKETAAIINNSFSLPILIDDRLNERSWGIWENHFRDEFAEQDDVIKNIWRVENLDVNPHQGETTRALMVRIQEFLNYLTNNHDEADELLVVTHGGPMCMMLGIMKGLHDETYLRQAIVNGQIIQIKYENSQFSIEEPSTPLHE